MAAIAVGIDFGTANIRVGRWIVGRFKGLTDQSGKDAIPAYFTRNNGRDLLGQEARDVSTVDPANVIFDVMQFVGLTAAVARHKIAYGPYPFKIRDLYDRRGGFEFQLSDGSTVSANKVIQCLLEHVYMQCVNLFGFQEFSLAITVPSYWSKFTREYNEKELLNAAQRSGFTRVSLIDSQVAAALGCYLNMKGSKDIMVVDIGATDITARFCQTQLEGKTGPETFTVTGIGLGTTSADRALMRYLKEQFIVKHGLPVHMTVENTAWHLLRVECENARASLITALTTVLSVPNFAAGHDLHAELTRKIFDDVTGLTIAEDVVGITEQVLALSNINIELCSKDDFRLFLVGGGSRIPCIRQRMAAVFGSKIDSVALQHCEDAAVYGAAECARMIALDPDVGKLDIVQHHRDLCDFIKNHGKPWKEDGAARLAGCRSACTHTSTEPAVAFVYRITSIIPSMHGISTKTDRVSYRFSIRGRISDWTTSFVGYGAHLHHIELTQPTAVSLQLQQCHMVMLSFQGTLEQENLTGSGSFGNFEGPVTTIRNPTDLCHPNVVRCLATGRTAPMQEHQFRDQSAEGWRLEEKYTRMLLDMRLDNDILHDRLSPSSRWDITLHRYCKERGSSLGNKEIINKTKQLLDGLSYLHSRDIPFILGGLTNFGILVTPDGETVKIWDIRFGLLDKSPLQLDSNLRDYLVTKDLAYAHPDVSNYITTVRWDHKKCSTLTFQPYMDIWSLGCVVLGMVSKGDFSCINRNGIPLDKQMDTADFLRNIVDGGLPLIPSSAPDVIRRLCTKCFERKADRRTDAIRLLEMISKIPENEIDVCSIARPKQPSASLFEVSEDVLFEVKWVSHLAEGSNGVIYTVDTPNTDIPDNSVHNNLPEAVAYEMRSKKVLKILNYKLAKINGDLLVRLSHNHVVKYITTGTLARGPGDIAWDNPKTGILMEHCTGGDLNQLAQERNLSATEILEFARQIASGLAYLHDNRDIEKLWSILGKPIAHGDMKGKNIFLTEAPITSKIGDLDSFAILEDGQTNKYGLRIEGGTYTHMSPEMAAFVLRNINGEDTDSVATKIGRATDIYSFGCVILEMFDCGNVPYSTKDGLKLKPQVRLWNIVAGAHPDLSITDNKDVRSAFRPLLEQCLQREPRNRPTASDLLKALVKLRP